MRGRLTAVVSLLALLLVAFLAGRHYWGMFAETETASIGGPFTLVDTKGRTVTDRDFRGRKILVYFGYTYCPDVCPTSLTTIAEALEILGDKAEAVTPIFISVDPERDNAELLAGYAAAFHPRLIALTGTAGQVREAANAYRVYYAKVPGESGDPEDYLIDHSASVYLMDEEGRFLERYPHGIAPDAMARGIAAFL